LGSFMVLPDSGSVSFLTLVVCLGIILGGALSFAPFIYGRDL